MVRVVGLLLRSEKTSVLIVRFSGERIVRICMSISKYTKIISFHSSGCRYTNISLGSGNVFASFMLISNKFIVCSLILWRCAFKCDFGNVEIVYGRHE